MTNALAPQNTGVPAPRAPSLFPSVEEWSMMREQAGMLAKTGFFGKNIDTPEKAIALMMKGRELGLPPMTAIEHLHVVDGKVGLSATLMLARINAFFPGAPVACVEESDKACTYEAARAPGRKLRQFRFTLEDAQRAGLTGKDNWRKYPKAMLHARAVSTMTKALFPEVLMGTGIVAADIVPAADVDEGVVADAVEVEAQPVAAEPSKDWIFDGADEGQRAAVKAVLVDAHVHPTLWDTVKTRLRGRAFSQLGEVIAEVRAVTEKR